MRDFLTFESFIAVDMLIIGYYMGAVIIPLMMWLFKGYIQNKIGILKRFNQFLIQLFGSMSLKRKVVFSLVMFMMFLAMEIMWRMMFEAMIGYFQMIEHLKMVG